MRYGIITFVFLLSISAVFGQIDNTPPTISVSHSPTTNIRDNIQVFITASASDTQSGMKNITIYSDGIAKKTCTFSGFCSYNSTYAGGAHSYYATASDNSGNRAPSPTNTFTVLAAGDTTPPSLFVLAGVPNPSSPSVVVVTATASDPSGVQEVKIYIGGALSASCTSSPCQTPSQSYAPATYSYYATATDFANNIARDPASGEKNFTVTENGTSVDETPPVISGVRITPTNPTTLDDITINVTAADEGTGIKNITIYVDGVFEVSCNSSPCAVTKMFSYGQRMYIIEAFDNSGNSNSTEGNFFVADRTKPSVAVTTNPPNPTMNDDVVIRADVVDAESGLSSVQIYVNGALKNSCNNTPCNYTSKYSNGAYSYRISATDNSGNSNETAGSFVVNFAPTVNISYTGSCNVGSRITVICTAVDANQEDRTLDVRLWAGECPSSGCSYTTASWTIGSGKTYATNTVMSRPQRGSVFNYSFVVDQTGGTIAATCRATDSFGSVSNWGDAYPLCVVGSSCVPPTFRDITIPQTAGEGTIKINFTSSRLLLSAPSVTVTPGFTTGSTQSYPATNCATSAGFDYTCDFAVDENYPNGRAKAVITGTPAQTGCSSVTGSSIGEFTIDTQPPQISYSIQPANPRNIDDTIIRVIANDAVGVARIDVNIDGGFLTTSCPSFVCGTPNRRYAAGTHTFTINVLDKGGNTNSTTNTFSVTDVIPPVVNVDHKPSNPTSTDTINITANASDDSGLSQIKIFVDDAETACAISSQQTASCSILSTYNYGQHFYNATATDAAGNTAKTATKSFNVRDAIPPTINTPVVTPATIDTTSDVKVEAAASDTGGSGLRNIRIFIDNTLRATCTSSPCNNTPQIFSFGDHSYRINASDNDLNTAEVTGTFSVADTNPPAIQSVSIVPPNPTTTDSVDITVTASDAESGLDTINITVDDIPHICESSPCSKTQAQGYSYGSHDYVITVNDSAGNIATQSGDFYVRDVTKPSIDASHSPQNPASSTDAVDITANAADAGGSGLKKISIFVDDVNLKECSTAPISPCSTGGLVYSQGVHSYYAAAEDVAGNTNTTDVKQFLANDPPHVRPAYFTGDCKSGETVTLKCDAYDSNQDANTLLVNISIGTCGPADCSSSFNKEDEITMNTPATGNIFEKSFAINKPQGTAIAARCNATDAYGSSSSPDEGGAFPLCVVNKCDHPPAFENIKITPNPTSVGTAQINFTNKTQLAGRPDVRVNMSGFSSEPSATFDSYTDGENWTYTFLVSSIAGANYPEGDARVIIVGSAAGSNCVGESTGTFEIDKTPPHVFVTTAPADEKYPDNISIVATATDDETSVKEISINVDGENVLTCSSSPCQTPYLSYPGPAHQYYANAADEAGNLAKDPPAAPQSTKNFVSPPLPDFNISSGSLTTEPLQPITGTETKINFDIRNIGTKVHTQNNGRVSYRVQIDDTTIQDGFNFVDGKQAHKTAVPVSVEWTAKYCWPDNSVESNCKDIHMLSVGVDSREDNPRGYVTELLEDNNEDNIAISVNLTDLGYRLRDRVIPLLNELISNATAIGEDARSLSRDFRAAGNTENATRYERIATDASEIKEISIQTISLIKLNLDNPDSVTGALDSNLEKIDCRLSSIEKLLDGEPLNDVPVCGIGCCVTVESDIIITYEDDIRWQSCRAANQLFYERQACNDIDIVQAVQQCESTATQCQDECERTQRQGSPEHSACLSDCYTNYQVCMEEI